MECNKYCSDGSCNKSYNTEVGYLASTTGNISGIYDMSGGAWEHVMGVMMDQNGNPFSGRNNDFNSNFVGELSNPSSGSNSSKTSISIEDGGIYFPDFRYYDLYNNSSRYILNKIGGATGEMGPFGVKVYDRLTGSFSTKEDRTSFSVSSWYNDYSGFLIVSDYPWLKRGGQCRDGEIAGIFSFSDQDGSFLSSISFRVVLNG